MSVMKKQEKQIKRANKILFAYNNSVKDLKTADAKDVALKMEPPQTKK